MQQTLEVSFQQAMSAFQEQNWPQAESLLKSLLTQWPDCIEACYQLAELYQLQQRWEQALFYYEQVLTQNDQIQEVWLNLGRIAAQQNQTQLAQQYWTQALAVNPDYSEAHFHLGLVQVKQAGMAEAVSHLIEALKQSPELAQDFLELAQEYAQQGQCLESLALAEALLIQETPEREQALLLKIALLHDLGHDQTALSLANLSAELATYLRLYVSQQTGPDAEQQAQWSERLAQVERLQQEQWPERSWPYLPRLRSWYLFGLSTPQLPLQPQKRRPQAATQHLIWLVDYRSISWLDWALLHFGALPAHWRITLVLRFASLQRELSAQTKAQVLILPPEPEAAQQVLSALQATVILWSDPDLDPLQYWLSRCNLAELQLSWAGRSFDFEPQQSSVKGHLQQWPLYPLPTLATAQLAPNERNDLQLDLPLLLCPLPALGLLAAEREQLKHLATNYQLLFFANPPERPLLTGLLQDWSPNAGQLPISKIWRQPQELEPWFQQAQALYLPQKSAELYALLAYHYGVACCSLESRALPWGQTYSAEHLGDLPAVNLSANLWLNSLPATRWAVELQAVLNQRRNP